jgi:hypothetical protein
VRGDSRGVADPGGLGRVMHEGSSRWAAQNAGLQISWHSLEDLAELLSQLTLQATLLHYATLQTPMCHVQWLHVDGEKVRQ